MSRLLAALSLVLFTGSALAADSKPNTLSPKDVADGWILLFDGETSFGWKSEGEVKAAEGVVTVSGDKDRSVLRSTSTFPQFELRFEYQQPFNKAAKDSAASVYVGNNLCACSMLSTKKETWNEVVVEVGGSVTKSSIRYSTTEPPMTKSVDL